MSETVVLAPANYEIDPERGSEPERPWRLMEGLSARGVRVVAVAQSAPQPHFSSLASFRLLPGRPPATQGGRLVDRVRLYVFARAVAILEVSRGEVLAVHHFGPCSRSSPSLLPKLSVPVVYGPMPGGPPRHFSVGEWSNWLGGPDASTVQILGGAAAGEVVLPIARALWKRTIRRVDAVTVEARANIPVERRNSVVIPPGVDTKTFCPDGSAPIPGRVLSVGLLLPRKGFDVLLRAFAIAEREIAGLHLLIAGDGPERTKLEILSSRLRINSKVSFLGRVPRKELPSLYRSALVAVHPAREDTFPVVPIEAMACGTPVLVSDSAALPEMVGDGGLVHPVGDYQTLAADLVRVFTERGLRCNLAQTARDTTVVKYSWDLMAERYLALYQDLRRSRH